MYKREGRSLSIGFFSMFLRRAHYSLGNIKSLVRSKLLIPNVLLEKLAHKRDVAILGMVAK